MDVQKFLGFGKIISPIVKMDSNDDGFVAKCTAAFGQEIELQVDAYNLSKSSQFEVLVIDVLFDKITFEVISRGRHDGFIFFEGQIDSNFNMSKLEDELEDYIFSVIPEDNEVDSLFVLIAEKIIPIALMT